MVLKIPETWTMESQILPQIHETDDAADLTMSKSMYVDGLTITKNDFVMLQTTVIAVVEYCGKAPNADFFWWAQSAIGSAKDAVLPLFDDELDINKYGCATTW